MYEDQLQKAMAQEAIAGAIGTTPDIRKQLNRTRINAVQEIDRCDRLLQLLDANPDITEILQLLGRGGRY